MSIRAIDWAFRQKVGSWAGKLVLVKLADNANDDGLCWPSRKHIEQATELSRDVVRRHIGKLQKSGLLRIIPRELDGAQLTNEYQLNIDPAQPGRGGLAESPGVGLRQAPNRKVEPVPPPTSSKQIEAIYSDYPRKVGKPKALLAIKKAVAKFGVDFVAQRTRDFQVARRGQDVQFTPHPATWFNQERFNDDPSTWINGSAQKAQQKGSENFPKL